MTAVQKMKGAKGEGASQPISASCGLAVFLGALGPSGEKPGRENGVRERGGREMGKGGEGEGKGKEGGKEGLVPEGTDALG